MGSKITKKLKTEHSTNGIDAATTKTTATTTTAAALPTTTSTATNTKKITDALNELDDCRISNIRPLIPPQILMEELPVSTQLLIDIFNWRNTVQDILQGKDDRLLVVVGPCSIHDVKAAMEYASKLAELRKKVGKDVFIVMRVYFEKPRTTVGWKGLINDPFMDGTYSINKGLRTARQLLLDINDLGVPCGCEFLDTITPQFIGDLVSWGAIGARTTESQIHRELASGLSVPVGFKNGTDGNVKIAIDAIRSASSPHCFLSVTKQGLSAIVETSGNEACHVILRGSNAGPNYSKEHVKNCQVALEKAGVNPRVMIDFSHGNSQKQHKKQLDVGENVGAQISEGSKMIVGVMIESNLIEGRQDIPKEGTSKLVYGKSVTDACIHWQDTVHVINTLQKSVLERRTKH